MYIKRMTDDTTVILSQIEEEPKTTNVVLKKRTFRKKSPLDKGLSISYENYILKKINLADFKLPDLKNAAKSNKLHITGTKPVLIQRLEELFNKIKKTIILQSIFRGRLARVCLSRRGPAFKNRKLCVNDTDFVTMEPLIEISPLNFFSYKDEKEFTYGFHIASLIHLLKTTSRGVTNPYNREQISAHIIGDALAVYNASHILSAKFRDENSSQLVMAVRGCVSNRTTNTSSIFRNASQTNPLNIMNNINNNQQMINDYRPTININSIMTEESNMRLSRIQEIRTHPIEQRIHELFAEIDRLGNYTQSSWFSNLSHGDYGRLYRALYEIWNFRSQLPRSVRNKICPFHSPFDSIFNRPVYHTDLNFQQIQKACLIVIENMVYSGVDEDHRKLGAFHALSGLTLVSMTARNALPWLYESLI
jgi:SAP domain